MNQGEKTDAVIEHLQNMGSLDDVQLRESIEPSEWEATIARMRTLLTSAAEQTALVNVLTTTMLLDAAGFTWSFDGQVWRVWNGTAWADGTPQTNVTPQPAGMTPVPAVPDAVDDAYPLCPACGSRNPAGVFICTICGADPNVPAGELWQCSNCERWNAGSALNCPSCGAPKTNITPDTVPSDPGIAVWQQDLTRATPAVSSEPPVVDITSPAEPSCRRCGGPFPDEEGLCANCRAETGIPTASRLAQVLAPDYDPETDPEFMAPLAEVAGVEEPTTAQACTNCGAAWDGVAVFCTSCGTSMASQLAAPPTVVVAPGLPPVPVEAVVEPDQAPEPVEAPIAPEEPAVLATERLCTHCAARLAEGMRFCIECGTPADAEPEPPVEVAPEPPAALVCTKCGAELADGARFCINCGTPVAT